MCEGCSLEIGIAFAAPWFVATPGTADNVDRVGKFNWAW
jgi:hypothetical protein